MPFDRGSITCRICYLPKTLPKDVLDKFQEKAAPSLDNLKDEVQLGWVSGRHLLERRIDEETAFAGGYLHLCLRQAQKKIPASLLRAECRMAELAQQAAEKRPLNRKERKLIKEETILRLLPQMPPQLAGTYFAVDHTANRLYVTASSDKQLDTFLGYFVDTVGYDPVPLTPEVVCKEQCEVEPDSLPQLNFSPELADANATGTLGQNFLTWLWWYQEENNGELPKSQLGEFGLLVDGPLVFVADGAGALESSIRKGLPTRSAEAKAALMVGKKLKRATIQFARAKETWKCTVEADSFLLRGLSLPEGEAMEPHSVFEERMTYLHIFQQVFYALFQKFVQEFKSGKNLDAFEKKAKAWVKNLEAK